MEPSRNRQGWAERTGEFSPAYYADLGPNKVSNSLVTLLEYYADRKASILELGCSSGRHLAHLQANGFDDLTGIDINDDSFEVMADTFPALAEAGTFYTGAIEKLVPEFPDDAFDVVYAVETLQHVHPDDEGVFAELVRVADDLLVTVENEGPDPDGGETDGTVDSADGQFPIYRRHWGHVFTDLGLEELLAKPGKSDTIRAFGTP